MLTAKVIKVSGGGASYFVDCPYCGKTNILWGASRELGLTICEGQGRGCYKQFKLIDIVRDENETQT